MSQPGKSESDKSKPDFQIQWTVAADKVFVF